MDILFCNNWIDKDSNFSLVEVSFHSCIHDFGFFVVVFGLGVGMVFIK